MNVTKPCYFFIYFTDWIVPEVFRGTLGGDIMVQRDGSKYSGSKDTSRCPIYNYTLDIKSGDSSLVSL